MAEGYNKEGSYTFKYDTDELVQAKTLAMYNANLCATANGLLAGASNPESGFITTVTSDYNMMKLHIGSSNCYEGEPYSEITSVDFSLLESAKSTMASVSQSISEFNDEMDRMIGIIIKYVDPDLAEELDSKIKKIERAAIKDYMDLGAAGAAIDLVQLYKLLSKYDPDKLGLSDSQKAFFEYVVTGAKAKIDYDNMSFGGKVFQNCVVFGASVVDGVLYVGEEIIDGAVLIGGEVVSLAALAAGPDAREAVINGTFDFIDVDWSGKAYDAFVDASGLNKYAAYGSAHKIGLAAGKELGGSMLALIPGGKAAQVVVGVVRSAGASAQSTAGKDNTYREASAAWAAIKSAISSGIEDIPDGKAKNVVEIIQGATDETGDKIIDYYLSGETDDPTVLGFIKEYGADCVLAAGEVAVDKGSKYVCETYIEGKKPEPKPKEKEPDKTGKEKFKEDAPKNVTKGVASSSAEEVVGALGPGEEEDETADEARNVDYVSDAA